MLLVRLVLVPTLLLIAGFVAVGIGFTALQPDPAWPDHAQAADRLDRALERSEAGQWRVLRPTALAAASQVAVFDPGLYRRTVLGGTVPVDPVRCGLEVLRSGQSAGQAGSCLTLPVRLVKAVLPDLQTLPRGPQRAALELALLVRLTGASPDELIGAWLLEFMPCPSGPGKGLEECGWRRHHRLASSLCDDEILILAVPLSTPEETRRAMAALGWSELVLDPGAVDVTP